MSGLVILPGYVALWGRYYSLRADEPVRLRGRSLWCRYLGSGLRMMSLRVAWGILFHMWRERATSLRAEEPARLRVVSWFR